MAGSRKELMRVGDRVEATNRARAGGDYSGQVGPPDAGPRRARRFRKDSRLFVEALSLLVGACVWQAIGVSHPRLLPTVNVLATTTWHDLTANMDLQSSIGATMVDVGIGFVAAMLIGIAAGTLMGLSEVASRIANMYLYWLLAVPEIAMVPFYIILFGFGAEARLVIVFFFALPVVTQRVLVGVNAVSRSLTDMAIGYELSRGQIVRKILFPAVVPSIFTGARLGFARAMLGIITAGFFLQLYGLGGAIYNFEQQLDVIQIFVYLGALVLISLVVTRAIQYLDARLTPWNRSVES